MSKFKKGQTVNMLNSGFVGGRRGKVVGVREGPNGPEYLVQLKEKVDPVSFLEREIEAVPEEDGPSPPAETRGAIDTTALQAVAYVTREWIRSRALYGDDEASKYVVKALGDMVLEGRVSLDRALAAAFSLGSRGRQESNPQSHQAPPCGRCGMHRDANVHLKQYIRYHEYVDPSMARQTTNYGLVLRAMWEQLNAWAPQKDAQKAALHAKLMDGIAALITPATELDALIAQEEGE